MAYRLFPAHMEKYVHYDFRPENTAKSDISKRPDISAFPIYRLFDIPSTDVIMFGILDNQDRNSQIFAHVVKIDDLF